jgi:hypothetical protein
MTETTIGADSLGQMVERAVAALDFEGVRRAYWDQDEFVFLERFLPPALVAEHFLPYVQRLRADVHRAYVPRFKKGGSVSFYTICEKAPAFLALYRSPAFLAFLSRLVDARLTLCPEEDPHSCALYYYTEPGDHIGFHYDTSYYKGARYTVLVGLVQRSEGCRLVCRLHKGQPGREPRELQVATEPGSMVIFNGAKLWHAVTPLREGEERVSLTLEYVTDPGMAPLKRLFSNMKDAFAYFGVRTLLRGRR